MEFRGKRWTNKTILDRIGNRRIRSLDLYDTSADDELLIRLAERGALRSLVLSSDQVTDAGIQAVARCCKLESLMLHDTPLVTDRSLNEISGCSTLRELYLDATSVTDGGIGAVAKLQNLWSLSINRTAVTDLGLARIGSKQIHLISFDECAITGAGFSTWSVREKMSFYTNGSWLDDEGFATACKAFPFLWNVVIENTRVTNDGLRALAGQCPTGIRIRDSNIDRDGVLWIIENLPDVHLLEVDATQFSTDEAEGYRDYRGRYLHVLVSDELG